MAVSKAVKASCKEFSVGKVSTWHISTSLRTLLSIESFDTASSVLLGSRIGPVLLFNEATEMTTAERVILFEFAGLDVSDFGLRVLSGEMHLIILRIYRNELIK